MIKVVEVRFKRAGKIYYFDPMYLIIEEGTHVIVETARGIEYGEVVMGNIEVPEQSIIAPLKSVLRVSTPEDDLQYAENLKKAKIAHDTCLEKIIKHSLDMKLIDVEYTFDNNKVLFYFTADGRVDFRELVKDLASVFKTRIELRQLGVRDEAKAIGGIGICGRVFCCASCLGDFQPVSIKMAKEQGLSLNPTKISGTCGRLMCCLKFEQDAYEEAIARLPGAGSIVETIDGQGVVMECNLLRETIKVKLDKATEPKFSSYKCDAVKIIKREVGFNTTDIPVESLKVLED